MPEVVGLEHESGKPDVLERRLRDLEVASESLSLPQIKAMFGYIGIPVALATSVFGVALWNTIKLETSTVAQERATTEIAQISADIDVLRGKLSALAQTGEEVTRNLDYHRGRATYAAQDAAERAEEVRTQLTLIKNRVTQSSDAVQVLQNTDKLTTEIVKSESFQAAVSKKSLSSFVGMIAAFDGSCPKEQG